MRNRCGRWTGAAWLAAALVGGVIGSPATAVAQNKPTTTGQALVQVLSEVRRVRNEASALKFTPPYCKPPGRPTITLKMNEIRKLQWRLSDLTVEFRKLQRQAQGELARYTRGGLNSSAFVAGFPMFPGDVTIESENYWQTFRAELSAVEALLTAKEAELKSLERDCPKAVDRPPPPAPPQPPPPPSDPLAGLNQPTARTIDWPTLKDHYCSQDEKDADWKAAQKALEAAQQNADDEEDYRKAIRELQVGYANTDGPLAIRRELQTRERTSTQRVNAHRKDFDRAYDLTGAILKTKVIDCSPGQSQTSNTGTATGGWDFSVTGGFKGLGNPKGGTFFPTPDGVPFNAFNGRTTDAVESWATRSGANLLNTVLTADNRNITVVPLDPVLYAPSVEQPSVVDIGIRAARMIDVSRDLLFVVDVDFGPASRRFGAEAETQIEKTRSTVAAAWNSMLSGAASPSVSSTATLVPATGAVIDVATGIEMRFSQVTLGGWTPSAQAGVVFRYDPRNDAAATLVTDNRFTVGSAVFREVDTVKVSGGAKSTIGIRLGGNLERTVSPRMSMIAGASANIFANNSEIRIETTPSTIAGTQLGIVNFNTPTKSLQISTAPNINSSLNKKLVQVTWRGNGLCLTPRFFFGVKFRL